VETNKLFTELLAQELLLFTKGVGIAVAAPTAPTVLSAPAAGQRIGRMTQAPCQSTSGCYTSAHQRHESKRNEAERSGSDSSDR
jgi:hypothetical protein